MASTAPPRSLSPPANTDLQALLDTARPFLHCELEVVDPCLPSLVATLRSVGAGECWHKNGTFLDHLVDMYRILRLWGGAPPRPSACAASTTLPTPTPTSTWPLKPNAGRDAVRSHVGNAAEHLIHLFCIVQRPTLIHDDLLFRYDDSELIEHLKLSEMSLWNAKDFL